MDRDDAVGGRGSEWSTGPSRRITPDEVQGKEFGTARVRVGYRMHEVDEFLDQITDTLSALTAENERLRAELAAVPPSGRSPAATISPADGRTREAVEAFLQREKAFLQSLGSLVQGHAEELKGMVRASRAAAPTASSATPAEAPSEAPVAVTPQPAAEAPVAADEDVAATAPEEAASEDPDETEEDVAAILDGDDRDPRAIETVGAEEPIRVDEPQPASSRRSDEGPEGSLRELFWGEE